METEDKVSHLSTFVHFLVGLNDHGDEDLSVCLSRSHNLLQTRIETEVTDVLFFTAALTIVISNAGLYKLHTQEQRNSSKLKQQKL